MKRIIALAVALWIFSATFAFAGKIVSYNPSSHKSIRIIETVQHGSQTTSRQSHRVFFETDGGCLRLVLVVTSYTRTVTYNYGTLTGDAETATEIDRQTLTEFCF